MALYLNHTNKSQPNAHYLHRKNIPSINKVINYCICEGLKDTVIVDVLSSIVYKIIEFRKLHNVLNPSTVIESVLILLSSKKDDIRAYIAKKILEVLTRS